MELRDRSLRKPEYYQLGEGLLDYSGNSSN
jgi:hypothetical protein